VRSEGLLAHSRRGEIPAQSYVRHVTGVWEEAIRNARAAVEYYTGDGEAFIGWVSAAAAYHDLGKLDDENQAVLRRSARDPLRVPHDDAGVAALDRLGRQEAAVLVAAHHAGLFSRQAELAKQGRSFRRTEVSDHVDQQLDNYLALHRSERCPSANAGTAAPLHDCGFTRRLALSCLVDADHGDTARHYAREEPTPSLDPRWGERLAALDRYVASLPGGRTAREQRRNQLRARVYAACRAAAVDPRIRSCDAPVGSGKTTAVMAHLLRVAEERRLRHVFVVLPYTNIITQAVSVYRQALVLDGERREDVVAEHHHRADFETLGLRQVATLWKAPVVVTTAVQFFETLGSHHPASLRKLHELPGSAVFVDEMHAAMPSHLWPQVWRWLEALARLWSGHVVLASGSLPRFWELPEYQSLVLSETAQPGPAVPDLMATEELRTDLREAEEQRVRPRRRPNEARIRLRERLDNWTLVATSCVEAGMDFSFRVGFRERASTASLIQVGGRVSRGDEHEGAEVWDLLLLDERFRQNPALAVARQALDRFSQDELRTLSAQDLATEAMRREWTCGAEGRARALTKAEESMEYPTVAALCRVIDADTATVLIDRELIASLRDGRRVSKLELQRYSVQIWASKLRNLGIEPIERSAELYAWPYDYDPDFLGYMAGILRLERFMADPEAGVI
jgi:CRISPR-associated endonuclease/helicase Cas3